MKWFYFIIGLLALAACEEAEEYEVSVPEESSFLVYKGQVMLQPIAKNQHFWMVNKVEEQFELSKIDAQGRQTVIFRPDEALPTHLSEEDINSANFRVTNENEHLLMFAYDTVVDSRLFFSIRHFKANTEGDVLWTQEFRLPKKNEKGEYYAEQPFLAYLAETELGSMIGTIYTQLDEEEEFGFHVFARLMHFTPDGEIGDEIYQIPLQNFYISELGSGSAGFLALSSGKLILHGGFANENNPTGDPTYKAKCFSVKGELLFEMNLDSRSEIFYAEEVDGGVIWAIAEEQNTFGKQVNIVKTDWNGNEEWSELTERFENGLFVPYSIEQFDNTFHCLGTYVQGKNEDIGDLYNYRTANLGWIIIDKDNNTVINHSLVSESPTVGLGVLRDEQNNWTLLAAQHSFELYKDIAIFKFNPDGELID